ncbi:MAG TPA: ATP phosphoribosyltransferase [Polyangiaceae bacterium]|nr:ATP phosphoribosyltransferase [Polyangiaceae bacterium]
MTEGRPLTIAIPKGRVQKAISALFAKAGLDASALDADDRRLVRQTVDGRMRFLLLKPDDVPTYVEFGAADLGISGRDVLLERRYDLYQPLDLGIGRCRMVVAAPIDRGPVPDVPRVATKYPRIATEHFAARGVQVEIIFVQSSVEIAPLVGLADLIVDLVETGSTLKENHLTVLEEIVTISSVVVANRASYKLRAAQIAPIVDALGAVV